MGKSSFHLQTEIDEEWFVDCVPQRRNPSEEFKRQMEYRRNNPFEARWVTFPNGKRWLFINAEPQDWTMY